MTDNMERAKKIIAGTLTNHPDRSNEGMRIVGFRVSEDVAGLSDAIFALDEVVKAVNSHDKLVEALEDAMSALQYVRENHGDLYGVGFDRVREAGTKALIATMDDETKS